ncbi:MAG TPA: hypothetical protein PKK50_10760 [Myxococcota bacterium]|nr:hypothetical protein [Myxococcota bacterium]
MGADIVLGQVPASVEGEDRVERRQTDCGQSGLKLRRNEDVPRGPKGLTSDSSVGLVGRIWCHLG